MQFVHQPAPSDRLGDYLKANFKEPWTRFRAAIAFVKRSGTKHIAVPLAEFSRTNSVEIIAGIDLRGTSQEGLQELLDAVAPNGRVIVFHNRLAMTFHPKIYLFKSDIAAEVIIGSGNLTEGGLFTNYEASMRLQLDLTDLAQSAIFQSIDDVLNSWADPSNGTALPLDATLLARLVALGLVPVEALSAPETGEERTARAGSTDDEAEDVEEPAESPFAAHAEPRAPSAPRAAAAAAVEAVAPPVAAPAGAPAQPAAAPIGTTGFVIILQRTDVGVGQTTAGTSRRSPEIFIPLRVRDANPDFWGWPDTFVPDPNWSGKIDREGRGKMDRKGVMMRLGGNTVPATIWYNPDKSDIRIRSEPLRSAGNVGDILRIEKADSSQDFDYYVEIIPQGTTQYPVYRALCTQPVPNSQKTYGYY